MLLVRVLDYELDVGLYVLCLVRLKALLEALEDAIEGGFGADRVNGAHDLVVGRGGDHLSEFLWAYRRRIDSLLLGHRWLPSSHSGYARKLYFRVGSSNHEGAAHAGRTVRR